MEMFKLLTEVVLLTEALVLLTEALVLLTEALEVNNSNHKLQLKIKHQTLKIHSLLRKTILA